MARILSWFTTKRGKLFTNTCIGIAAFSTFATHVAINGPYKELVREMCQVYSSGKPKPLSEKLEKITKEVLKDSKFKDEEKKRIQFFHVVGLNLYHLGATNSPWGSMIGIPFYFEESDKINFGDLRMQGHETIDWIIDGHDFLDALAISDKAKKFGLMREIYSCNVWDKLDNALLLPCCILVPAEFARRTNIRRDAFNRLNLKTRILFYACCFGMGMILYRLLKDPLEHVSAKKYDKLAAQTGPDYLEGGIEFYEHTLLINKALRQLLGKAGESKYDKNGNEDYFIFAPKLPTSKRLEFLKDLQKSQVADMNKAT